MVLVVSCPASLKCRLTRGGYDAVVSFDHVAKTLLKGIGSTASPVSLQVKSRSLIIGWTANSAVSVNEEQGRFTLQVSSGTLKASQGGDPKRRSSDGREAEVADTILPGLPSSLVAVVDGASKSTGRAAPSLGPPSPGVATEAALGAPGRRQAVAGSTSQSSGQSPVSVFASVVTSPLDHRHGLMLPFDDRVGAAAFRRGDTLLIVFDGSKPLDLSGVAGDPIFGRASFSLLSTGTIFRMELGREEQALVRREPEGWFLTLSKLAQSPAHVITPVSSAGKVVLAALKPSHVIVVPDPVLGADLLVGTVRQDDQAITVPRRTIYGTFHDTILGVVIERLSDRLELRPVAAGFAIDVSGPAAGAASGGSSTGAALSRAVDLPAVGSAELQRRYKAALASAAASPPATRGLLRLDAAQAALGLGQGREAGNLAAIAEADAPGGVDPERGCFLQAAAAVLEHRPDARALLADNCAGNSDEVGLWRALEASRADPTSSEAAGVIAERLALLQSYPDQLKQQLTGMAALSLAQGGTLAQAAHITDLGHEGDVALATAMLAERQGRTKEAMLGFRRSAADRDPAVEERATEAAVALGLRQHDLDPAKAADLLQSQTLNARMAGRELPLRLQVAKLRIDQKDWRAALADLRDLLVSFPEARAQIEAIADDAMRSALTAGATTGGALPPGILDQVSLVENNLDLLPAGDEATRIALALSERLGDLDLPDQAATLLRQTMKQRLPDQDSGLLGLQLARLEVDQNDPRAAIAALDMTEEAKLSPELGKARVLLRANALASQGNTDACLNVLNGVTGPEAEELRAGQLAIKHDWGGEAAALTRLVASRLPATGLLSREGEELVLRLVEATARCGDQEALQHLSSAWAPRFQDPHRLAMLRLLASPNVASVDDLPRSATDIAAGRAALPIADQRPEALAHD